MAEAYLSSVTGQGVVVLLATLLPVAVWLVVTGLPGERRRWIFRTRPLWLFFWLRGECSLPVTFMTGGPLAGIGLWWLCAMGVGPEGRWLSLSIAALCVLLGLALLNAARKSRPEGAVCAGIVMLITLLWLAGGCTLWQVLL